jgi:hypothetical protein
MRSRSVSSISKQSGARISSRLMPPKRRHGVDELLGIDLVDLEVENVDTGELLEQDRLAFHDRLGGESSDIAQAEDRRTVRDHSDEVLSRRIARHGFGVLGDFFAGRRDAGGIGKSQVSLIAQRLQGLDFQLARLGELVEVQGRFPDGLALFIDIGRHDALSPAVNWPRRCHQSR